MAHAAAHLLEIVGGDLRLVDSGLAALRAALAPIYPIIVWGKGRSGKSTFLNHVLCVLADKGLLSAEAEAALRPALGGHGTAFITRLGHTAVTHGIDILCVGRQGGGTWVLFDTEGVGNVEGPPRVLDAVLATGFSAGGTHVCITTENVGDDCIRCAGRVAVAGVTAVAGVVGAGVRFNAPLHAVCLLPEGQRPTLDVIINKADKLVAAPGAAGPYITSRFEDDADKGCNFSREVRCSGCRCGVNRGQFSARDVSPAPHFAGRPRYLFSPDWSRGHLRRRGRARSQRGGRRQP